MNEVIFLRGLSADYFALESVSNDVFYYLTDTDELYFGSKKITNAADLTAAISRIAANEEEISTIKSKIGNVPAGKTLVEMIEDSTGVEQKLDEKIGNVPKKTVPNPDYDPNDPESQETIEVDQSVMDVINDVSNSIDILNGDVNTVGSVEKKVRDGIAEVVAAAPSDFDTLKEISDWIGSHASDASAMNSQINTNTSDISNLNDAVGANTSAIQSIESLINAMDQLPSVTASDVGKVLKVNASGEWDIGQDDVGVDSLPSVTVSDEGKILKVSSEGEWSVADEADSTVRWGTF